MSSDTVTILSVGSYTFSGVVAELSKNRQKLLARTIVPSAGMRGGIIKNIRSFSNSIFQLVGKLEKHSSQQIEKIHLALSGCSMQSFYMSWEFDLKDTESEISKDTINFFSEECFKKFKTNLAEHLKERGRQDQNIQVLEYYPIEFILDDIRVDQPVGMIGTKLSIKLHIICCDKSAVDNMIHSIEQCHLGVEKILPSVLLNGLAFLTEEEKKNGTLIIDFGDATTTLGLFLDGKLCYLKSIDMGAYAVTENIFRGLSLNSLEEARIVKTKNAYAVDINMTNGDELVYISQNHAVSSSELFDLVADALNQIFKQVDEDLVKHQLKSLIQKVYVVGGGSNMMYINQYIADFIQLNVQDPHYDNRGLMRDIPRQDIVSFLPHCGFIKYILDSEQNPSKVTPKNIVSKVCNKILQCFGF